MMCVILSRWRPGRFSVRGRKENKRRRAAALVEAARSLAVESGVASVTLTAVAGRAGIHYSAVRRYFTSHKEVLLHLRRRLGAMVGHCVRKVDRAGPDVAAAGRRGLLFDTLIVRSFMMPSVAALMGRWFWWPQKVRTRPVSQMLRPYGPRSAVRAYMLPWDPTDPRGSRQGESPNGERASTDRFPASAPHY
jgi:AcrR family transcriptional regulator